MVKARSGLGSTEDFEFSVKLKDVAGKVSTLPALHHFKPELPPTE